MPMISYYTIFIEWPNNFSRLLADLMAAVMVRVNFSKVWPDMMMESGK